MVYLAGPDQLDLLDAAYTDPNRLTSAPSHTPIGRPDDVAAARKPELTTGVELSQLDPLYAARDYVFNNVLMMIGIDGEITPVEIEFARKLAREMGYDETKLGGILDLAKNRQLALRLPENRKTAIRVRQLMEKAARADRNVSPTEQALLNEVSLRINTLAA